MNRPTPQPDDSWESDAVWKLLGNASSASPRGSFTDDVVRAAKLSLSPPPWWKRVISPAPIAGLAAATIALVFAIAFLTPHPGPNSSIADSENSGQADSFANIQDIAETETLIVAADHLEDFSDQELASLLGF